MIGWVLCYVLDRHEHRPLRGWSGLGTCERCYTLCLPTGRRS